MPSFTLYADDNRITAHHAGKSLNLSFQRSAGGTIPLGSYTLSAPVRDTAYGTFAILIPTRKPACAQGSGSSENYSRQDRIEISCAAAGRPCRVFGGAAAVRNNAEGQVKPDVLAHDQPAVILVAAKQLPGRDVLVVKQGFFDLMSALSAGGGAEVQVI